MRVVSVANQKGGCGKTTVAVNLASAMANLGARVLLVDNDPQGHATLGMGLRGSDFSLSTRDLYLTSDVRVEDVCHTVKDQLDLVPCAVDLSTVDQELTDEPRRLERLVNAFAQSDMPYDVVLLDNPPNVGLLTFNSLMASGEVLVPVDPGRFTLEAVDRLRETLDLLEAERGHRVRMHLLPNGFDVRTRFGRDLLERMAMSYPHALLDTQIHRTVRLREAADLGQPVDVHDRRCRAVLDFQGLAEELWTLPADLQPAALELAELEAWDTMLHGPRTSAQGVRFEVVFPTAREVSITGDFTNWSVEGLPLERVEGNTWRLDLPLDAGVFEYKYIVDGVWKVDPENPERVRNSYGQLNSLLTVPRLARA